eukprot:4818029-Amphidinium_carterae.1
MVSLWTGVEQCRTSAAALSTSYGVFEATDQFNNNAGCTSGVEPNSVPCCLCTFTVLAVAAILAKVTSSEATLMAQAGSITPDMHVSGM